MSLSLFIVAVFLAYVAVPFFGNKALIVRSGSMTPAIGVGDLVVVKTATETTTPIPGVLPKYRAGDIVAFTSQKDKNTIITHRIVGTKIETDKILYQTQGDANNAPDNNFVEESKIIGKNTFTVPALGKVFAAAKTKEGFFALILAPAVLVILFEIFNIAKEIGNIRKKHNRQKAEFARAQNNYLMRLLVPFILGTMFFQNSYASYADTEISQGNNIQASADFTPNATPPPEPNVDGGLVINEFMASPSTQNSEWVEFYNPSLFNIASYFLDDDANFADDTGSSPIKSLVSINNADPQHPYLEYSGGYLNNGGDSVVLFAPDGSIVDQHTYGSIGADISIGRSPDGIGNFQNCAVSTKGILNGGC